MTNGRLDSFIRFVGCVLYFICASALADDWLACQYGAEWRATLQDATLSPWFPSDMDACVYASEYYDSGNPDINTIKNIRVDPRNTTTQNCRYDLHRDDNDAYVATITNILHFQCRTEALPCDTETVRSSIVTSIPLLSGDSYCYAYCSFTPEKFSVSACAGTGCTPQSYATRFTNSGNSCAGGEPVFPSEELPNCVLNNDGVSICFSQSEENCGYVNGEYICAESVPEGGCTLLGGGGYICDSDSTSLPSDDQGVPIEPDAQVSDPTTGETQNYHSETTINNTIAGGGDVPGADPVDGTDGGCIGPDCPATGSASGGATCDVRPSCSGDPVFCMQVRQQWETRCSSTRIEDALTAEYDGAPVDGLPSDEINVGSFNDSGFGYSRTCPVIPDIVVFDQVIEIDQGGFVCTIAEIAGILLLIGSGVAGLRIAIRKES